jgi:hypothetical protein
MGRSEGRRAHQEDQFRVVASQSLKLIIIVLEMQPKERQVTQPCILDPVFTPRIAEAAGMAAFYWRMLGSWTSCSPPYIAPV